MTTVSLNIFKYFLKCIRTRVSYYFFMVNYKIKANRLHNPVHKLSIIGSSYGKP